MVEWRIENEIRLTKKKWNLQNSKFRRAKFEGWNIQDIIYSINSERKMYLKHIQNQGTQITVSHVYPHAPPFGAAVNVMVVPTLAFGRQGSELGNADG